MINIAWIISGFFADENDFGGVAAIHNLAKEISEHPGISLTVFAMYYPLGVREFELYGAKVFTFNSHSEPGLSWMQKLNLWRQLRKKFDEENRQKKFDLIHSFWAGEPGYVASKLSRKHNIPFIANICGGELANFPEINYGQQLNSRQQHFIKKTFDTASIIISGSDFITEIAGKMFDSSITSKVQKIPFGVDEKLFDPSLHKREVSQNQPVLINIANCVPVKAHSDLLKALAIVKQNYPNVLLKIYGLDEENYIMKTAKSLGLENNVQVNGSIDHRLIPQALASADVFVLSSLYESQNMAILEAAFMSLPVVSTDVGIAREITPYISTPGEHTVFAENIIKAINSPKPEYKDLREKFSLISISNKFTEMYVEMMNNS